MYFSEIKQVKHMHQVKTTATVIVTLEDTAIETIKGLPKDGGSCKAVIPRRFCSNCV